MWASEGKAIEVDHPVSHEERVVIWQRYDAGPELDPLGPLRGGGDEQFGRGDRLVSVGMVLPDPCLVVTELVEPLHQLEVPPDRERRVVGGIVEGPDERAKTQGLVFHGA
jgi:hypothetical protein